MIKPDLYSQKLSEIESLKKVKNQQEAELAYVILKGKKSNKIHLRINKIKSYLTRVDIVISRKKAWVAGYDYCKEYIQDYSTTDDRI